MGSLMHICIFPHILKTSHGVFTLGKDTCFRSAICLRHTLLLASVYQAMSKYVSDEPYIELVVAYGLYRCGYLHTF